MKLFCDLCEAFCFSGNMCSSSGQNSSKLLKKKKKKIFKENCPKNLFSKMESFQNKSKFLRAASWGKNNRY